VSTILFELDLIDRMIHKIKIAIETRVAVNSLLLETTLISEARMDGFFYKKLVYMTTNIKRHMVGML